MPGKQAFFDTNILLYAFAKGDPRADLAANLLARGGTTGVQALNEFVAVARRKLGMPWEDVQEAVGAILTLIPSPAPITLNTHRSALRIARRNGYHIYDALVIASALAASCATLYSEDLHDGQVIEGLTIRNPFRKR